MTHTGNHIRLLIECEKILSTAMLEVAKRHKDDAEAVAGLRMLSAWSALHAKELQPLTKRYKGQPALSGRVLRSVLFKGPRKASIGMLRDLQDLALLAHAVHGNWTVVDQAAAALRDAQMKALCDQYISETLRQIQWIDTQIKARAAQALIA